MKNTAAGHCMRKLVSNLTDGSCHKSGHSSHTGIGVVIDLLTGLPIDYEILSNFCQQCQLDPSSEDEIFDDCLEKHSAQKNYAGSSNSM